MPSTDSPRRRLIDSLSALASAVPLFRPGSSLPAAAAPFLGAPPPGLDLPGTARRSHRLRRSLRASSAEGMVAEVVTACVGGAMLTAWALHLGCSPLLVGVLNALGFFAQLVQLPAAWVTSLFGHRRVALWGVSLSRQALLPLVALPLLPISSEAKQHLLVGVATLAAVLGVVGNNAWVAWMGDLIPPSVRGSYFGRRTALCTLGGTLASLAAGTGLDWARAVGRGGPALSALALCACAAGAVCTYLMSKQGEAHLTPEPTAFSWRMALEPLRDRAVRPVLLYQVGWNASVGLAAGYFSLHMIQNLHMGFQLMALQGASVAVVRMVAAPVWGRVLDRVGARPVLLFCSIGISVIPAAWLFARPDFLWPLLADAVLAGVLWGGHAVAAFNLPLAVAPRRGRAFYLAAFSTAGGLSFAGASTVGGVLLTLLPDHFTLLGTGWQDLHVLFILSALARLATSLIASQITEPGAKGLVELKGAMVGVVAQLRPRR